MQVAPPFPAFGQAALREIPTPTALALYDDPETWAAFTQTTNSPVERQSTGQRDQKEECQSFVVVRGMHCAACALTLESALLAVKGVRAVQVSAASASASPSTRASPSAGSAQQTRFFARRCARAAAPGKAYRWRERDRYHRLCAGAYPGHRPPKCRRKCSTK